MSDEAMYTAMREFIRSAVALEVLKATADLKETLTRSAPKIVEGPPGKDGKDGADGKDGCDGIDGKDGAPGKDGQRGVDGIATREELNALIEERVAEVQVRTFADIYQGVYENGREYTRGLLTTWGGSLWMSRSVTKGRPGESPDWTMVVKRGDAARK